ncbi:MAG: choline BCCT transporter BetT [Gammaproteobacteria bacterium]|nr:choline BCCT transporter BetT [Gammaproteobacteria bacterium]
MTIGNISLPRLQHKLNSPVFYCSSALIFLLVGFAVMMPTKAETFFKQVQNSLITNGGWFYILLVALILICVTFLALSKYGDIKLGPDHATPDFSFSSWFAMLFSAGMGIGLMFYGVSEPVMHFLNPPIGDAGSIDTAKEAMKLTFFHWGFHAWAIYAIVALILAFFTYRHDLPLTLRSALYPLIGDRIHGPIGDSVDIFAVIGTIFGVATSMGLGVMQINSGLGYLFDIPVGTSTQVILIIAITCLATLSVATGLEKGIRRLSEANLLLALILLLVVMTLGPTVLLLQTLVQNTGSYLSNIVDKTFNLYAYKSNNWLGGWTLFYWAYWLSWSPFVGMFIARISRGRTIREFIVGVLLVPSLLTFIWMTVFGNTAIDAILHHGATELSATVQNNASLALFKFLEMFPFSGLLSLIAILMVVIFFVTSADSSAMVIDILASGGATETPLWQRVFWSVTIGVVAMALMLAGGLQALQAAMIASALPFMVVLIFAIYGLLKALALDVAKKESLTQTNLAPATSENKHIAWQHRLSNLIRFPRRNHVQKFNAEIVIPAMKSVAAELKKQNVECTVDLDTKKSLPELTIFHGDEIDFTYQVFPRAYLQPSFMTDNKEDEEQKYFRAEVFLREGGQNYDIMGWSKDQVISDIVNQYEKHMHFLHMVR